MSVRAVRLDEESERALQEVVEATGLSTSAALKRGVLVLRKQFHYQTGKTPYDVYAGLDLGPGGYARAPSTETRRGVRDAIREKLGR